jgi:hypothetical protein
MRYAILLSLLALAVGCKPPIAGQNEIINTNATNAVFGAGGGVATLVTVEHDGCEWIACRASSGIALQHKPTCRFCADRLNEVSR